MKTAVILFNLGGPDKLENVKPFLFNLFKDKAILSVPAFIRYPLAALISSRREEEAKHIYAAIGGGSPLVPNTLAQARALESVLNYAQALTFKVFTVMRYWHPFAQDVAQDVAAYAPDKIIYLPLYPQFSTTTTQSSFEDFDAFLPSEFASKVERVCCYPTQAGLISAYVDLITPIYEKTKQDALAKGCTIAPRILFSAHGLPEKTIKGGDPYQWQVFETTKAVVAKLQETLGVIDWKNTFQSRVGPLKWIEPYTDKEIEAAGAQGVPLLIVPIAFVSEHSETLYEIEQQYRELAAQKGVPVFSRVPAVATHPTFIQGLANLVTQAGQRKGCACAPDGGIKTCPPEFKKCPCRVTL
jgi:protoporphyrin/coproporphyrin ferrochelatase